MPLQWSYYRVEKKNKGNKPRNKNKNKITPLGRKDSKRNFKSYNVYYEEQNNSDSDLSFNFFFNITTNIINVTKSKVSKRITMT